MAITECHHGDRLFNTAALYVKGALCVALEQRMSKTVKKYHRSAEGKGYVTATIRQPAVSLSEHDYRKSIQTHVDAKLTQHVELKTTVMSAHDAVKVYGDCIENNHSIKCGHDAVLVILPEFAMDIELYPVLHYSTFVKSIQIDEVRLRESTITVEFSARMSTDTSHKGLSNPNPHAPDIIHADMMTAYPLALCLPPSGVETAFEMDTGGVTPYEVDNADIDYDKLIHKFGSEKITQAQIDRIEKLTGMKAHRFLKRGIFFSHRDLDTFLDAFEGGSEVYLYTGRGPSSDALHLGHLIPFLFTKYLQDAFKAKLVIQLTDDEKYLFKPDLEVEEVHKMGFDNSRDIIAVGFNRDKTFIFSDIDYIKELYPVVLKIQKRVTYNQSRAIFGFSPSDNIGKAAFPAIQAAPSFSDSFPHMFPKNANLTCMIPHAIDQDPYFRMTRDVSHRLGFRKPVLIHSKFFPALTGFKTKMSSSIKNTTIFLTDTKDEIETKMLKFAFSGGGSTLDEHKSKGANLDVDVAYQYMLFFFEDDDKLKRIADRYSCGEMSTTELKKIASETIFKVVDDHQKARNNVTDDEIRHFQAVRNMF